MNFWHDYGIIIGLVFLYGCLLIPRITILITFILSGGFLSVWSIPGMILGPRITIAFMLTKLYWGENPFLLLFVWILAIAASVVKACLTRNAMECYFEHEFRNRENSLVPESFKEETSNIPWTGVAQPRV